MTEQSSSQRFDAMDSARATAMLLGVFFHSLLFGGMVGGRPPAGFGPPGQFDGSTFTQDLLHSFRMPLFFLISGFFCRMMLRKYGIWTYLIRRWWRIGLPLLIGVLTFAPMYQLVAASFRGGPPPSGSPIGGPPMGGFPFGGPPLGGFPGNIDDLPPPPPGFVPPPLIPFDKNQDGSIDAEEWQAARKSLAVGAPSGNDQSRSPKIEVDPTSSPSQKNGENSSPNSSPSLSPAGGVPMGRGGPSMPPGGPGGMFGPPGPVSSWIFGSSARLFTLSHLWFLWYLLIFATVAPFVVTVLDWAMNWTAPIKIDRIAAGAIHWQVMPLVLGLISLPFLLLTRSIFGWSLGLASGIGRGFPDFLWQLEVDMPFYGIYFLIGWLLHRMRDELPAVALGWWINLAIGFSMFVVANFLSRSYAMQTSLPYYGSLRLFGYGLYAVGAAYLAWGFLGTFQRFLDRPSSLGRYLADTALWVYLLHQALLFPFLAWLAPFKLSWWVNGGLATGMTIAASLLIFESVVRHTPLMALFGPAPPWRPGTERFEDDQASLVQIPNREQLQSI